MIDIGLIASVISVVTTAYAAWNWFRYRENEKRLRDKIAIEFVDPESGETGVVLPYRPPRRTISRAEILGLMGMVRGRERFEIAYLQKPEFMSQLDEVYNGSAKSLRIPVTAGELEQFDLSEAGQEQKQTPQEKASEH